MAQAGVGARTLKYAYPHDSSCGWSVGDLLPTPLSCSLCRFAVLQVSSYIFFALNIAIVAHMAYSNLSTTVIFDVTPSVLHLGHTSHVEILGIELPNCPDMLVPPHFHSHLLLDCGVDSGGGGGGIGRCGAHGGGGDIDDGV